MDLIIHEAGHYIFFLFGSFIHIAGGSLMQLIMPALFAFSFFRTGQNFSGSIMFYWLAINFFNVGQYAGDAVNMNLELLGGDNVLHDWHELLSMTHLLNFTKSISEIIYFCGIVSICAGIYFSYRALNLSKTESI